MRHFLHITCCVMVLSIVSSCHRRVKVDPEAHVPEQMALFDEARLTDVSLPVGVQAYDLSASQPSGDYALRYTTRFTSDVLRDFYVLDMERLGWDCISDLHVPNQVLLNFEKPSRKCSLIITDHKKEGSEVILFVYQKRCITSNSTDLASFM